MYSRNAEIAIHPSLFPPKNRILNIHNEMKLVISDIEYVNSLETSIYFALVILFVYTGVLYQMNG